MKRYESEKLWNMGPVDGFIIHTPDDRKLKDLYPQFIVRELNRMADRINKLENENDAMRADLLLWKDWVEEERGKQ